MKGGPKSSLRPFLHQALQLLTSFWLKTILKKGSASWSHSSLEKGLH